MARGADSHLPIQRTSDMRRFANYLNLSQDVSKQAQTFRSVVFQMRDNVFLGVKSCELGRNPVPQMSVD